MVRSGCERHERAEATENMAQVQKPPAVSRAVAKVGGMVAKVAPTGSSMLIIGELAPAKRWSPGDSQPI